MEKRKRAFLATSLLLLNAFRFARCDEEVRSSEVDPTDLILAILKHYQQPDPVGLPGVPIPDPMEIPDTSQSSGLYTMDLRYVYIHGLKEFRIEHARSNMSSMQVSVGLDYETLDIRGYYDLSTFFLSSNGNFTVRMTDVHIESLVQLDIDDEAKLYARDIDMDMSYDDTKMNFENLSALLRSVLDTFGPLIVSAQIPTMLEKFNSFIKRQANDQISKMPTRFPNSISPFDALMAEARKSVSRMGYDPYKAEDYIQSMGFCAIALSETWITGLSSFYRTGNATIGLANNTLHAALDIGTQKIEGRSNWEASVIGGVLSRSGTVYFDVDSVRLQVNLSQPLDTRRRATLEHFDVQLGNIQSRVHGAGTMDYLVEVGVNIFPNLLRNRIMGVLEGPIQKRIQEEIDKVDLEKLIREEIPDIEEQARKIQQRTPVIEVTTPVSDPYNQGLHPESSEEVEEEEGKEEAEEKEGDLF